MKRINLKNTYYCLAQILNAEESMFMTPVEITGNESQCDTAKQLIDELIKDEPVICKYDCNDLHLIYISTNH